MRCSTLVGLLLAACAVAVAAKSHAAADGAGDLSNAAPVDLSVLAPHEATPHAAAAQTPSEADQELDDAGLLHAQSSDDRSAIFEPRQSDLQHGVMDDVCPSAAAAAAAAAARLDGGSLFDVEEQEEDDSTDMAVRALFGDEADDLPPTVTKPKRPTVKPADATTTTTTTTTTTKDKDRTADLRRDYNLQDVQPLLHGNERCQTPRKVDALHVEDLSAGSVTMLDLELLTDALGRPVRVPVMVAKGAEPGPILGLLAAVHGNELSGIPTIHSIFRDISRGVKTLRGTVVAVPVVNVFGFQLDRRGYLNRVDLNRVMPGRRNGTESDQFAYQIFNKVIKKFHYLLDLHTASFGHLNTMYTRADMKHPVIRKMAELLQPDIMLHHAGIGGSVRAMAQKAGIPCVCVEVGDPQLLDRQAIKRTYLGILDVMEYLKMITITPKMQEIKKQYRALFDPPVLVSKSRWIFTNAGGLLMVPVALKQRVQRGDVIAVVTDIYGFTSSRMYAPQDGIVIGKTSNPSNLQGSRVLHLGYYAKPGEFDT